MSYKRYSHYKREDPLLTSKLILFFAILVVLGVLSKLKVILTSPAFYIILIAIYVIYRQKKNKLSSNLHTQPVYSEKMVNMEKHSYKCYMDGLSYGEQKVADLLSKELSYKNYYLFNNVILASQNNGSTQIDHIVVSRFGIFVIESKEYQGWIFGTKDQEFWTQSLPGGNNKFQFQNPLHQNYAHTTVLKEILPFVSENIHSIVVFSGDSEFKTSPIENVVKLYDLVPYIMKYSTEVISEENLHSVIGKLSFLCQTVDISSQQHIENLKRNHKE